MSKQKREHFRIVYNADYFPHFLWDGGKFRILDISEKGLKFTIQDHISHLVAPGDRMEGQVRFRNGQTCDISGEVLRVDKRVVVLGLSEAVPGGVMMEQHRILIQRRRSHGA